MPQVLNGLHLGEEPVAADVKPPAVALGRTADAADDVVGLVHLDRSSSLGEPIGRREARWPGADHTHRHGHVRLPVIRSSFKTKVAYGTRSVAAG